MLFRQQFLLFQRFVNRCAHRNVGNHRCRSFDIANQKRTILIARFGVMRFVTAPDSRSFVAVTRFSVVRRIESFGPRAQVPPPPETALSRFRS